MKIRQTFTLNRRAGFSSGIQRESRQPSSPRHLHGPCLSDAVMLRVFPSFDALSESHAASVRVWSSCLEVRRKLFWMLSFGEIRHTFNKMFLLLTPLVLTQDLCHTTAYRLLSRFELPVIVGCRLFLEVHVQSPLADLDYGRIGLESVLLSLLTEMTTLSRSKSSSTGRGIE